MKAKVKAFFKWLFTPPAEAYDYRFSGIYAPMF